MGAVVLLAAFAIAVALASCATSVPVSNAPPPLGPTQALLLRTDPAGASCSISRDGVVAASVDVTPGIANVPRGKAPIEVVCRKGDLEHRTKFGAVLAHEVPVAELVAPDGRKRERSAGALASEFAAELALRSLAAFFPPAAIGIMAAGVAVTATAEPTYAFRALPRLLLAPAVFDSAPACDDYFASLKGRLEAEADAQRARVGETCHPWPCGASDSMCPNPLCGAQRERIDAELASQLDQIPALRARVRISPP